MTLYSSGSSSPALQYQKSLPTCTLSLAHVSASSVLSQSQKKASSTLNKAQATSRTLGAMQVELQVNFSSVVSSSVPVQIHVSTQQPTVRLPRNVAAKNSRRGSHLKREAINCIPFPVSDPPSPPSSPIPPSSDSSLTNKIYSSLRPSSAHHVLLRATKPGLTSSSTSSKRRTRNDNLKGPELSLNISSSISNSSNTRFSISASRSAFSNTSARKPNDPKLSECSAPKSRADAPPLPRRAHAQWGTQAERSDLVQASIEIIHDPPARPLSPTPHSPAQQLPLNDNHQKDKSDESLAPPPYSLAPPPYSASAIPLHLDKKFKGVINEDARPLPSPPSSLRPTVSKSSVPSSSLPRPSSIPVIVKPAPLAACQPRRQRIPSSELKVLKYLYRTIVYGLEHRYRPRSNSVACRAANAKSSLDGMAKATEGASRFPLVEEDDDDDDNVDPLVKLDAAVRSHVTSQPQRGILTRSKSTTSHVADLDVQDALLAIRLRGFLKTQGVTDKELDISVGNRDVDSREEATSASLVEEALEMNLGVDDKASSITFSSPSIHPDRPIRSSPPPVSPIAPEHRTVFPASDMIAILTMRHRMNSNKRKGFGNADDNAKVDNGFSRGRSGLRVCSWIATEVGAKANNGLSVVEELEEELDAASVVDWYSSM